MQDTICAISTPQGIGGIAVVRISGSDAILIADKLFHGKHTLSDAPGYSAHYGTFADTDDVIATVFRTPHSFTGEDTVEIACHGSLYIQQEILRRLIDTGCRPALPGEFTRRAFLNGKMDLSEAEAVADLIAAESKAAHEIALNHLRGGISNELKQLRDRLLQFTSLVELELDFADHEELEFADRSELKALAKETEQHLKRLVDSFQLGNALKNGVPVAIVGATNAGKSTLLNALVGDERAIVSDIHGTTRDTIEDTLRIEGVLFRLIDTAGIRQTDNTIENIGIERSKAAAGKAAIVIVLHDATQTETDDYAWIDAGKRLDVYNKSDLLTDEQKKLYAGKGLLLSAKRGETEELIQHLIKRCRKKEAEGQVLISNIRHYNALKEAMEAIVRVEDGLENNVSGELLSMDLQDCLSALGEITGEITSQEVLNNIFKHFCIGK